MLYYDRRIERVHFVRQSIHTPLHMVQEVRRIGNLILNAQWTLERTIGNLGEEIRQPKHMYANLSQRGLYRAQLNALKAMDPTFDRTAVKALPTGGKDIGDGYQLLPRHDDVGRPPERSNELEALKTYLSREWNTPFDEERDNSLVKRWARLALPGNGQVARSQFAEKEDKRVTRSGGPISPSADSFAPRNGSAASESRFTPALITPQFNFDPAQPMVDASMLDLLGNFGVNPFSDGIETSYSDVNASPLWDNLGGLDFTAHTGGVDQRTHHGFISDPLTHDAGAYVDYAASFFAPDTLGGTSLDEFFDPVIYGSFGASIPAAVVDDPLQAFLDSFQDGAADLSLGGSGLNSATLSAIPSLPPPPTTPSPSPPTERVEQRPIAPRSRRQRTMTLRWTSTRSAFGPVISSFTAIIPIAQAELLKPLPERYIHSYIKTKQGKIIIVTFVPYLLKLLDDSGVTSFDGDTTYKGIVGKVNEWELTIFAKVVQRAASILRAYIDGASADFFEELFDELQRVKLMVTGRPIPLKKFVRGGNLIVANVDGFTSSGSSGTMLPQMYIQYALARVLLVHHVFVSYTPSRKPGTASSAKRNKMSIRK
ncbi:hypothetical protein B0H10DRAFT_2222526 [Mycena sp. CBHHK59/15]|nr:hypothetical protein B0H10DRAFT_2222526 [Mycena sp. CBHHK59/15]